MGKNGRIIINSNQTLLVPDYPIIPFIEGDGIGSDIWYATRMVIDAGVHVAYSGNKKISWLEIYAGEKGYRKTAEWLPGETL
ncbi:MAG: NADP-dependent isocitrate dehydrogenase, partial [Desulfobacterales bacterium]|nr:NADP-dependent isocitrate dehydrogenase [Desulfobacterales bacterium]